MGRFARHYASCHTEYGVNRQCNTCARYFFTRRNLNRHVRGGRCAGKPKLYCPDSGRLFYHGRDGQSMRANDLCTRKCHNENAYIAVSAMHSCMELVDVNKAKLHYALCDLPLRNSVGESPLCIRRVFNPVAPDWPMRPHPFSVVQEPKNRAELDAMVFTLEGGLDAPSVRNDWPGE